MSHDKAPTLEGFLYEIKQIGIEILEEVCYAAAETLARHKEGYEDGQGNNQLYIGNNRTRQIKGRIRQENIEEEVSSDSSILS